MPKGAIVAIGGECPFTFCKPKSIRPIISEIVSMGRTFAALCNHPPRVLCVPTASGDNLEWCHGVWSEFGNHFGFEFDTLLLLKDPPRQDEIERKILGADVIYVEGGDTRMMMRVWEEHRIGPLIRTAHARGIVLAGISAGAICWFAKGVSDSQYYTSPDDWRPVEVQGLSLVNTWCVPHWDSEPWREGASEIMLQESPLNHAIAIDDDAAVVIIGDEWRVLSSKPGARACLLRSDKSSFTEIPMSPGTAYSPIKQLLDL